MNDRVERLKNYLGRWGRHDQDCAAVGSFNCDERCTCGLAFAVKSENAPMHVENQIRSLQDEVMACKAALSGLLAHHSIADLRGVLDSLDAKFAACDKALGLWVRKDGAK